MAIPKCFFVGMQVQRMHHVRPWSTRDHVQNSMTVERNAGTMDGNVVEYVKHPGNTLEAKLEGLSFSTLSCTNAELGPNKDSELIAWPPLELLSQKKLIKKGFSERDSQERENAEGESPRNRERVVTNE
ncbi:hypothetical protein FCV25MIE_01201 [Fagus crenata]